MSFKKAKMVKVVLLNHKILVECTRPKPAMSSSLVRASPFIYVHLVSVVVFQLAVRAPVVTVGASVISCSAVSVSIFSISDTLLIASVCCLSDGVNCFLHIRS